MKKAFKVILGISFIFYLFVLVVILFLNSRGYMVRLQMPLIEYIKHASNIIPFKTITTYVKAIFDKSMNMDIPIKNLGGNFILFLPMGIYLPCLIKKIDKVSKYSIFMTILLLLIEVVQLLTRRGSFDIDDFILNMFGALIGYAIWKTRIVQKLFPRKITTHMVPGSASEQCRII